MGVLSRVCIGEQRLLLLFSDMEIEKSCLTTIHYSRFYQRDGTWFKEAKLCESQPSDKSTLKECVCATSFPGVTRHVLKKYFLYCYILGTFTVSCLASLWIIV